MRDLGRMDVKQIRVLVGTDETDPSVMVQLRRRQEAASGEVSWEVRICSEGLTRTCAECQGEFEGNAGALYCSANCRLRAHRAKHRAAPKVTEGAFAAALDRVARGDCEPCVTPPCPGPADIDTGMIETLDLS